MREKVGNRDRGLRRRDLLFAAGGAVAAGAVHADAVGAMPPYEVGGDWISGVVERADADAVLVSVSTEGLQGRSALPTRVWMAPGHEASKEGPVGLSEFLAGERVAAHGTWREEGFEATEFEPLYRVDDLTVEERRGDLLLTTSGPVRLSDRTHTVPEAGHALGLHVYALPIDEIRAGSRLVTMSRENPSTRELVAVRVGAVLG